ncbi:MAG: hypothetical protein GY749_32200 [Desulfobacteraceae bacterium]|nr:hypothetical protein [Desulfobacteraceae bacterium]
MVAELGLKAMNLIDYSAMNMGWSELSTGTGFLKKVTSTISFPLITSNLMHKGTNATLGKKYVIKRMGDIRVGILGIIPPEQRDRYAKGCKQNLSEIKGQSEKAAVPLSLLMERLEIVPPEQALKNLLPEVRNQADIVILLSQYNLEDTSVLANSLGGIDLAISGRRKKLGSPSDTGVPVLEVAYQCRGIGYVKLTLDDTGKITQKQNKMIPLTDKIASDQQIVMITGEDINKKIKNEEKRKAEEEQRALLKLSPQEYYEKVIKEQQQQFENRRQK